MQFQIESPEKELLRGAIDPLFRVVQSASRHLPLAGRTSTSVSLWYFKDGRKGALPEAQLYELKEEDPDWATMVGIHGDAAVVPILPKPPDVDALRRLHVMAYSEGAHQCLLVDLLLFRGTVREAVQCNLADTVLEIFRTIAKGKPALWALQTTSIVMDWTPPEGTMTIRSYETPRVPLGSYVTIRIDPIYCHEDPELLRSYRQRPRASNSLGGQEAMYGHASPPSMYDIFSDEEGEEGTSFYMLKMKMIRNRQVPAIRHHNSFAQLPPPGNPVWWFGVDMERMDDWRVVGQHEIVWDAACSPILLDLHAELQAGHSGSKELWPTRKQEISLDAALRSPTWCEIPLPGVDNLKEMLHRSISYPDIPWNDIRGYMDEEQKRKFDNMIQIMPNEFEEVDKICIYTDGSYFGRQATLAGWAFAVMADLEDPVCMALDFGVITLEPLENGWVGATRSDARSGEATALIRALEWALAHLQFRAVKFCFDAQSVGYGADGAYGFLQQELPMKIARALTLVLRQQEEVDIRMEYVKAHSGVFSNELVDAAAKLAAKEQRNFTDADRPDYFATATGPRSILDSLWMCCGKADDAYPTIANGKVILPRYGRDSGLEGRLPAAVLPDQATPRIEIKTVKLSAITYNVQSLGTRAGPGQVQYLREQLAYGRYEIAFLQETRTKHSNMIVSDSHIRLCSEAENGKGGKSGCSDTVGLPPESSSQSIRFKFCTLTARS